MAAPIMNIYDCTINFSQISSQTSVVSMYNAHQLVKLTFRGILLQGILGTVTQKCENFKNLSPGNEDFPTSFFQIQKLTKAQ